MEEIKKEVSVNDLKKIYEIANLIIHPEIVFKDEMNEMRKDVIMQNKQYAEKIQDIVVDWIDE